MVVGSSPTVSTNMTDVHLKLISAKAQLLEDRGSRMYSQEKIDHLREIISLATEAIRDYNNNLAGER